MTTMCLSDEMLLAVRMGDAAPEEARHAAGCVLCARRLARLRADLARIDEILAVPAPSRRDRMASGARFAPEVIVPLAAAAMFTLVIATRWFGPPPAAGDDDVAAVLADVNAAFATSSSTADAEADDDTPGAIDVAFGARSTCRLDEPFIGVGCNDDSLVLAAVER